MCVNTVNVYVCYILKIAWQNGAHPGTSNGFDHNPYLFVQWGEFLFKCIVMIYLYYTLVVLVIPHLITQLHTSIYSLLLYHYSA